MKEDLLKEIEIRKNVYKTSPDDMISAFHRETEVRKEYNGRQLLELLQNADDESSLTVQIELDNTKKTLTILNKGQECKPFSIEGIKSLMISNLSSKLSKRKYIGNKGLGFRSIINWSEEITILSNNLKIQFSKKIIEEEYDSLFNMEEHEKNVKKRELPLNIKPIPLLSIPKISDYTQNKWTTIISLNYINKFEFDIKKQIMELRDEVLLFLNHIETLIIKVDDKIEKIVKKEELLKKWTIYSKSELLDRIYWDKETEKESYDLRIAISNNMKNDIEELFSYFPTKIDIKLPFIVHGTFELNSSRNEIIDSEKNKFILLKLVELISDTAKKLSLDNVSYKALEMLSYNYENNILKEFGFYRAMNKYVYESNIFPCIDGKYRAMKDIKYSENLSRFVYQTENAYLFENLLIPNNTTVNLGKYSLNQSISNKQINILSSNIKDIDTRVNFIYMIKDSFNIFEEKLVFLIDQNKNLVEIDDEVYTPPTIHISIPNYLKLKFIHEELYNKLLIKFRISGNDKARELQRILKEFTNIQSYEPAPIIRKIVSSANGKLKENNIDKFDIVKQMVKSLYENYLNLNNKTESISTQNINLLTKEGTIRKANELFLSKTYPSGRITEFLFSNIYEKDDYLADLNDFNFKNIEDIESIESFFIWIGVNKYTKFTKGIIKSNDFIYNDYIEFVFSKIDKPTNFRDCTAEFKNIENFDKIIKSISAEKLILWINIDKGIKKQLNDLENDDTINYSQVREYNGYQKHSIIRKPSYILFQFKQSKFFENYFIGNDTLSKLINDFSIDYENNKFLKYGIEKEEIDSLLLKIGATNKFENLTIYKIKDILNSLPKKNPDGKNTQTIYKLCIKHYEKNKQILKDINLKLFAIKEDEKKYYNSKEIYYSGNIKLPKKITDSIPILNFPKRLSTKNVINFFNINNLNELLVKVNSYSINELKTNDFNTIIEKIKPYILVHRIKDIDDEKTITIQLSKLKNINILLCDNVTYEINGNSNILDNNDYLKKQDKYTFYIKVDKFSDISSLIHEFDFQETFADIIGLVFDIQETRVFRDLIKEKLSYIEKSIATDFGSEIISHARELLGISDEIFSFWKNIFNILDKEFKYITNKKLISNVINELKINTDISTINYSKLNEYDTCIILIDLFKELAISPKKFNLNDTFYKVNFEEFHKRKLKQLFENSFISFRKVIYNYCLNQNKKENFINIYSQFEMNDSYISLIATKNKLNIELNYEEKVVEYIYEKFEYLINYEPTKINFQHIYDNNIKLINDDELDGNLNLISLLFFENTLDILKEYINKKNQLSENIPINQKNEVKNVDIKKDIEIINIELKTPIYNDETKNIKPYKYNADSEKNKKEKGYSSEEIVYKKLLLEYGEESVIWSSKINDSLGFDIKYKNKKNQWKFVEVKTFNSYQFYITENEKFFADSHIGDYEIFLVKGHEIYLIDNINFNDSTRFIIKPNQYIVKYSI